MTLNILYCLIFPPFLAADEWMKQFNLFYEEVKDLKKKDLDDLRKLLVIPV